MRKLLLGLLLFAAPAWAQEQRTFAHNYNLTATSYTYCVTNVGRSPAGQNATSAAASTTVTAVTGTPFANLGVGDDLLVNNVSTATVDRVRITAKASSASVTVSSAVTWANGGAGFPFEYHDIVCGTAVTDGWVSTADWEDKSILLLFTTLSGTGGVDASIECKFAGEADSRPVQIATANYTGTTSPTNGEVWPIPERCSAVRVGLKWGSAAGAGPDSMSAYIVGRRSK